MKRCVGLLFLLLLFLHGARVYGTETAADLSLFELERVREALLSGGAANGYYVYALCDRGVPFYIGKGAGLRLFQHASEAEHLALAQASLQALQANGEDWSEEALRAKERLLTEKLSRINESKARGDFTCVIVKWGLSEQEAFMCESALINLLTFAEGKQLEPLTNLVGGHASKAEKQSPADEKTKARTIPDFLAQCAPRTVPLETMQELTHLGQILFVRMNQLYPQCFEKGEINPEWLKDCARGAWRLRADRRASIRYLVALYRSRVVGIYRVTSVSEPLGEMWQKHQLKGFPTFPTRLRRFDRYRAQYPSFEAAMADLPSDEAQAFRAELLGPKGDEAALSHEAWKTYQTRVYFTVDDEVPPELMRFMGVRLLKCDKQGRLRLLDEQNPISYLFDETLLPKETRTP